MRWAGYSSVSVQVPASLPTRTSLCGGQVADEVVSSAGSLSLCPEVASRLTPHPGTVVWFGATDNESPYMGLPTTATKVAGQPAMLGIVTRRSRLGDGVSGVVVLPTQDVRVGVTASTREMVETMLASIRVDNIDPQGCPARLHDASEGASGPPNIMVPSGPVGAVRCEYGAAERLIGSWLLGAAPTVQLATALNQLQPDPCGPNCVHGGTPAIAPGHADTVTFRFADGTALTVRGGASGAHLDEYSNGRRTVANFSSSISELLARLTNQR